MIYVLFRLLHLASLLVFAGTLLIANMATKPSITGEDVTNLIKVDLVGSLAAILAFFFGLTLWLWVGKPAEFYSDNPLFHAKVALFFLIVLLALFRKFMFRRFALVEGDAIAVPTSVRILLRTELVVLVVLPILAFLAARGIGLPTAG